MVGTVAFVVAVVAAGVLAARMVRHFSDGRHRERGELEAALRPQAADGDGGTRRWRHVVVVPAPGELRFRARPGSVGLRLPLGAEETMTVQAAEADPTFRPGWKDAWFVSPFMRAVTLHTADGPMTLLLQPHVIPTVLARLER